MSYSQQYFLIRSRKTRKPIWIGQATDKIAALDRAAIAAGYSDIEDTISQQIDVTIEKIEYSDNDETAQCLRERSY